MTAAIGSRIPAVETLTQMTPDGPQPVDANQLFQGRKVVVFAVPGAFTPTCSNAHLPGFVARADEIKAQGVDAIICLAVNDAFVMDAWGRQHNADALHMIGDGSAELTRALGLDRDLGAKGMGVRSARYAMIVEDGTITWLGVEQPGKLEVSDADSVLAVLKGESR